MKKIILTILAVLLFAPPAFAGETMTTLTVIDSQTVAASGSYTSTSIHLKGTKGVFSIQVDVDDAGTMKFEWLGSNDGTDFTTSYGSSPILENFTSTDGYRSDGKTYIQFTPDFCEYAKIVATETAGANPCDVTVTLKLR